eukprot:Nitzschia sp. Nitz4//scaffold166_size90379//79218//80870//NITZ4_005072-RA/size90379-processed-gene-0.67-mRNA-1//-1//CDS//3329538241//1523//frame0
MSQGLTVRRAANLLEAGAISSLELSRFCRSLAMAGDQVWNLHAYEHICSREDVDDKAKASDDRRRLGEVLSPLDGIPVSVKSILAVSEYPLTAGSKILGFGSSSTPACGYDADVVHSLLRDGGSVLMGMTTLDEFAMGSLGNTAVHPDGTRRITKNPRPMMQHLDLGMDWASDESMVKMIQMPHDAIMEAHSDALQQYQDAGVYSAGGSSCGSAVSVAHGSALVSLGTDTGGSVRLPSAWCGLVGLKPSYGVLSRHGAVSYASSFDTIGILANTSDCTAQTLAVLAERDNMNHDSTFTHLPKLEWKSDTVDAPLNGLRIGIPAAFSVEECPESMREAWAQAASKLEAQGATVVDVSVDELSPQLVQTALSAYYVLVCAEASSNLSRYDGFRYGVASDRQVERSDLTALERQYVATRTDGFGDEVRRRILCGTAVLSSDRFHTQYEAAAKLRAALAQQLQGVLATSVDALLIPTVLFPPPRLDEGSVDSTAMLANDVMTVPSNLAGIPTLAVPVSPTVGNSEDIMFPPSMSILGPRLGESTLLTIGQALEG